MAVVYDDAYLAAEEEHHQAQRAKWEAQRAEDIARCGSVERYDQWVMDEHRRERRERAEAVARHRVYDAMAIRIRRGPAVAHRRTPPCIRPRPRTRRTSSSSRTSSADPGDGEPRPAVLAFACLSAAERGEVGR